MADFKLKLHRGEGMVLIAMNWCQGTPPAGFVGFAIEYALPGSAHFIEMKNRLAFTYPPAAPGQVAQQFPTKQAPIQKFRWVHFPPDVSAPGAFTYRVTPIFMDANGTLSEGAAVTQEIVLGDETYPGQLNITFTRGHIASQAFIDRYGGQAALKTLLPAKVGQGMSFTPTQEQKDEAYAWMGFEARQAIFSLLDKAVADTTAQVSMVAFDFNLPDVVDRLKKIGPRLRLIVDDSKDHTKAGSAEGDACARVAASGAQVKRQHMSALQHNKMLIIDGQQKKAVGGSTNFSWNGFLVQSNNAVIVTGKDAVAPFQAAFETYWNHPGDFPTSASAAWTTLPLDGIDVEVSFSPHGSTNARLQDIANDIDQTKSSLFYSLAFLYQVKTGPIHAAIERVTNTPNRFVYGMSDEDAAIMVKTPGAANPKPVYYKSLQKNVPPPFKPQANTTGIHLHHKFVVIDFDLPSARVYTGSHNFSDAADRKNGENLILISDAKVATAYMVEAVRLFDHYHFNLAQSDASASNKPLLLRKPPSQPNDKPWWDEDYTDPVKIKDRMMFCPL